MKIEQKETYQTSRGSVYFGSFVLIIGLILLAKAFGIIIPDWIMSWEMFIIGISLMIGFKKRFTPGFWIFSLLFGLVFIIDDIFPDVTMSNFVWPIVLIVVGIWFIAFKKSKNDFKKKFLSSEFSCTRDTVMDNRDSIEITSILSGIKKTNHSQNFKGGSLTAIMAGIELNLLHADIQEQATLNLDIVMGGVKLLVPSDWSVQSQVVTVMGGIEDDRMNVSNISTTKILILTGTATMGGIEIKSL